jgi:hypothetical protein
MIDTDLDQLIELFCKRNAIPAPYDSKDAEKVLERMKAVGLVGEDEISDYKKSVEKPAPRNH